MSQRTPLIESPGRKSRVLDIKDIMKRHKQWGKGVQVYRLVNGVFRF